MEKPIGEERGSETVKQDLIGTYPVSYGQCRPERQARCEAESLRCQVQVRTVHIIEMFPVVCLVLNLHERDIQPVIDSGRDTFTGPRVPYM